MHAVAKIETRERPREDAAGAPERRRNYMGTISLLTAVGGATACRVALATGPLADAGWLQIVRTASARSKVRHWLR